MPGTTQNTQRVMGKILVAGKRLNLGIRGPREKPSWGETRSSGTGGSTLDRCPDQSPGVRPISPSHQELRGTRRGDPHVWSTDQVGPGVHTLEWIFFRTCLQGLSLTVGKSEARSVPCHSFYWEARQQFHIPGTQ